MRTLASLLGLVTCVACATAPTSLAAPAVGLDGASHALEHDDFATARRVLTELIARCDSEATRREALLLLAAAELDPANIERSPRDAAGLAATYLLTSDADETMLPVARTLYRLAADVGRLTEHDGGTAALLAEGGAIDSCGAYTGDSAHALPETATPTSARIRSLESALATRSDSLEVLSAHADSLHSRVAALEAELERVGGLLRSGTGVSR